MNRIRALCGEEIEAAPAPEAPVAPVAAAIIPAAPIAPEIIPPVRVPTPEPVFDAPPEEIVEIEDYSPDDQGYRFANRYRADAHGYRSDVRRGGGRATAEGRSDAEVSAPVLSEIEELSPRSKSEFGADELGAVAPRESVRIEEPPAAAVNAAHAATGVHAALDVSAAAPELRPIASSRRKRSPPKRRRPHCRAVRSRLSKSLANSRASTPICSTTCSTTPAKSASSARAWSSRSAPSNSTSPSWAARSRA